MRRMSEPARALVHPAPLAVVGVEAEDAVVDGAHQHQVRRPPAAASAPRSRRARASAACRCPPPARSPRPPRCPPPRCAASAPDAAGELPLGDHAPALAAVRRVEARHAAVARRDVDRVGGERREEGVSRRRCRRSADQSTRTSLAPGRSGSGAGCGPLLLPQAASASAAAAAAPPGPRRVPCRAPCSAAERVEAHAQAVAELRVLRRRPSRSPACRPPSPRPAGPWPPGCRPSARRTAPRRRRRAAPRAA